MLNGHFVNVGTARIRWETDTIHEKVKKLVLENVVCGETDVVSVKLLGQRVVHPVRTRFVQNRPDPSKDTFLRKINPIEVHVVQNMSLSLGKFYIRWRSFDRSG
jgi:hypothetical protein